MFKKLSFLVLFTYLITTSFAQQNNITGTALWTVKNPFECKEFVMNNGQFTQYEKDNVGSKILYYTGKGRLHLYYTEDGFTIRMDSLYEDKNASNWDDDNKSEHEKHEDGLRNLKGKSYFLKMQWQGANPSVRVEAQTVASDYYTYPDPNDPKGQKGVTANAWKKLVYHNIYPGIDIEFYYPDKGGLEYNIIVHPGADPFLVKMKYSGDLNVAEVNTNADINWVTKLIDHAPTAKDETGNKVGVSFNINNNTVSFVTDHYDKSKTLTIDPWISATSLGGGNQAFDIGYDLTGNVYVYGGGAGVSYEEQKYNSGGGLVWTYTTTYTYIYTSDYFYGDLAVDVRDGTSYICEGFDPSPACSVIKVSTLGVQQAKGPGTTIDEEWRIGVDYCNNQLCLATGGESGIFCTHQDTNCTTTTGVNMLGSGSVWDQALLTFDNIGNLYVGTGNMYGNIGSPYGNMIVKMPLPSCTPTTYKYFDHHDFIEIQNIAYYPVIFGYVAGNGFNGLVATPTKIFSYDGGKMRGWQASTGAAYDSTTVSGTSYQWGGIALDCDNDIYCGNNKNISMYDTAMTSLGALALSNTVYDVAVSPHGYVYACGNGFVQCLTALHKLAKVTVVQPGCGCNGSATAQPCGKGPFTYSWSNGATTSSITNLCAGTYTLTVRTGGCEPQWDTAIAILTGGGGGGLTLTPDSTSTLCSGSTGTAGVTVTGGTSPYTYLWTPGSATTSSITGLSAGTYCVKVTDKNGCKDSTCISVTSASSLAVTTGPIISVSCNGGSNGSIVSTPSGGTPAYTYAWTPSGQITATATGLSAGTYTITVTDANGCIATASAVITQPTPVVATIGAITNVSCNGGANGSTSASGSGGTPPYFYSWTSGSTTSNATGLSAGTYTVTVTDINGCTGTASATITQPTPITATTSSVAASCGVGNGTATVTPAGGTGTYTYLWNPTGQTTSTATGLTAGTYSVTITDANGCTLTTSVVVTTASTLTATITGSANVLCNGGTTGGATVTAAGGTPAYTYAWTPGGNSNSAATGLSAGTYTITVTDANGCTATASVIITQPPLLTVTTAAPTNVLCNGGTTGSDVATAGGGATPYTYSWNTIPVQTSSGATGLSAGTYTVTVTDANGCTATANTTITQPIAITLTTAGFPTTCNGGNDGQATVIPAGGTTPYAYSWTNGATKANASNLTAGSYTVTVTDANGCSVTASATVTQPTAIIVAFTADTINGCAPLCTGLVDASTDPGGVITKWNWSYSDGGSDTVKNPRHCFNTPGTYNVTLTVTDNHGCTATLTTTNMITVYSAPTPAFTVSPQPTTILSPTIQFTDASTDAYGIASWFWNFSDPTDPVNSAQQNPTHTYGDTGIFCAMLTVTNIHGCKDSITECLVISPQYTLYIPDAFTPNGDGKDDIFIPSGSNFTNFQMYIFDRWGMLIYKTNDITKGWNGGVNNNSRICQEDTYVYLIQATDPFGQQHRYIGKVTLLQ
jgi:gliding motility-associated-like protein